MADEIIAKYKADLKDYNAQIKKGTSQAEKDFDKVDESASALNGTMGKLGAAVAAAFAVDKIASFTAEASKLAAQGEGVRKAFERIGDPQLLQGLRDATRGTVSDLELMKNAVKASNFKIPLQELAKLFEFARRRAKETGESVQFLVESITTGIGRKSPLILDNLGISAVALKDKLNGVSLEASSIGDIARVVGDIATEEMRKMGEEVESTNDKMQKLTASTENLKEALGTIANETLGPLSQGLATLAQAVADDLTELDRLRTDLSKASVSDLQSALNREQEILDALEKDLTARIGRISEAQAKIAQEEIDTYRERRDIVQELIDAKQGDLDIDSFTIDNINKKVAALGELTEEEQEQIENVAYWRAEIKRLQDELNDGNKTIEENIATVNALTHATDELNKILGKTKPFKDVVDAEETLPMLDNIIAKEFDLGEILKEVYGDEAMAAMEAYRERENELVNDSVMNAKREAQEKELLQQQYLDTAYDSSVAMIAAVQAIQQASMNHEQALLDQQLNDGIISREEYERKVGKLRTEAAKQSKDMALMEATTGTAMAVVNALSDTTVPYYLAVINSVAAAAIGAAEIATILSTPVPQFAKGTKNAPAGFKWVGEEGPELIYDQGGYPIITHRESMKIMEKYNIPSINYEAVEKGGFENMAQSATLNGFNDQNIIVATDRLRGSNKRGFEMLADAILKANRPKRGGYA